ncbi:MAG: hypothetical protein OJF55_002640 [Rhodanobacteraceae bacterium]|jgi:hypothetical protein|nr:MAG: hypothetical protein OJF55_002640 [Rhodanobacteraceae bacterium]
MADKNPIAVKLQRGEIKVSDAVAFSETFLKACLERGLGSSSKKDMELLLVHLLVNKEDLATTPVHEVSLLLQIPESRLTSLIYEAKLRFAVDSKDELRNAVLARLACASFTYKGGWVVFDIEDRLIRQAFAAEVKVLGNFIDGSFNREIVRVVPEHLIQLLERLFLSKPEQDAIVKSVKKAMSKAKKEKDEITFRSIMKKFLEGAAGEAGSLGVSTVAHTLTGGATSAISLCKTVEKYFSKGGAR